MEARVYSDKVYGFTYTSGYVEDRVTGDLYRVVNHNPVIYGSGPGTDHFILAEVELADWGDPERDERIGACELVTEP